MVNWNNVRPEDLEYAERAFNHNIKKEEYEDIFRNPFYKEKFKKKGETRYLIIGKSHGKYILAIITIVKGKLKVFSGREAPDKKSFLKIKFRGKYE